MQLEPYRLVFIDETGTKTDMNACMGEPGKGNAFKQMSLSPDCAMTA